MSEGVISDARWCTAWYYSELAQRHLSTMEEGVAREAELARSGQITREELDEVTPELSDVRDSIRDAAISAVVFAGMAIEAYIYDYSARNLGKSFTDGHVDTLNVESKWVVIPKLITGKSFPKDRQAFQLLKRLIKSRNALVHSKSRNIRPSELTVDAIESRDNESRQNARDAVRAIFLLAEEIEGMHADEMARFHLGVQPMPK